MYLIMTEILSKRNQCLFVFIVVFSDENSTEKKLTGSCYFSGDKRWHSYGTTWHPYISPLGYSKCAVCSCIVSILYIHMDKRIVIYYKVGVPFYIIHKNMTLKSPQIVFEPRKTDKKVYAPNQPEPSTHTIINILPDHI